MILPKELQRLLHFEQAQEGFAAYTKEQMILHLITYRTRLDAIINNDAVLQEAYIDVVTIQQATTENNGPAPMTPQNGNQGTEESPMKKLELTLPATLFETTKDNPALGCILPTGNSHVCSGFVLCDVFWENYDIADPETARK